MSYKNDSELTILNSYGKASSIAKAELYETYDRIRDLTVSGPAIGGSGMGAFSSILTNIARLFGGSSFLPTLGSEAINIPGTSYYSPLTGGTGALPGGNAAFGLAPFSQISGFPTGSAANVDYGFSPLNLFQGSGIGSLFTNGNSIGFSGIGDSSYPFSSGSIGGIPANGYLVGGAGPVTVATATGGTAAGAFAAGGFGRNIVMPMAGIVSGIGGLLTTIGPFFGPWGVAGAAAGSVLNGLSGAVLNSFQHVGNRALVNADTILAEKVKNLETTIKQLDAQQDIIKKVLKEDLEGDKKALDNI